MNTYDPTADNALDQSGWEETQPQGNKAQHSQPPTFNDALQTAKEAIGFFANGDLSEVAKEAKRLWYAIDDVQQGKASVNHAEKLAEALREITPEAEAFDCRSVNKAKAALAAYEESK